MDNIKKNKLNSSLFFIIFLIIGSVAVVFSATLSVVLGAADISPQIVYEAITDFQQDNLNHQIIHDLRIPRTLGSIIVGACFAVGGAIMQGMTRNPIADPGLMGINAGATFALSICLAFFSSMSYTTVILWSFIGAAIAVFIVYGVTAFGHGKQTPVRLMLAGTTVGIFLSACSQAIAMHFQIGQDITFWTAGGVAGIRMPQLYASIPFMIIGLIGAVLLSPSLTLLGVGEDAAVGLGLNIERTKILCLIVVLILVGCSVSLAGPISFIGLIIPHIARAFFGVDYKKIIPSCILLGSFSMVVADIISRLINIPHETPVGLIFSVIGVPFFLYISRKSGSDIGA